MALSTDEARRRLCALGDHVRDAVIGARGIDMAAVDSHTAADTIYGIDRVADDALLDWFEANWPGVEVVQLLRDAWSQLATAPFGAESKEAGDGGLSLLSVTDARGLTFDSLAIVGLDRVSRPAREETP